MGKPEELEYKIAMPNGALRLAVTYIRATDPSATHYWPPSLEDDSIKPPVEEFPTTMQFSPSTWTTSTAELGFRREALAVWSIRRWLPASVMLIAWMT
jgi:hypothetical protein